MIYTTNIYLAMGLFPWVINGILLMFTLLLTGYQLGFIKIALNEILLGEPQQQQQQQSQDSQHLLQPQTQQQQQQQQILHQPKGAKDIQCYVCGHKFRWEWLLKRHMRTHTGEKPFSCPYCPYRANRKEMIRSHVFHRHQNVILPQENQP